eukprot:scaffold1767_cov178-Ochromonas_danica.AAC.5
MSHVTAILLLVRVGGWVDDAPTIILSLAPHEQRYRDMRIGKCYNLPMLMIGHNNESVVGIQWSSS